jgi:hypothetical protein
MAQTPFKRGQTAVYNNINTLKQLYQILNTPKQL